MSYNVEATANFSKELKVLVKKYPSLKSDLSKLITQLEDDPELGTPVGQNCFKIRLAIKSKGRGKSTGGRVITQVFVSDHTVYLLSIYDKSKRVTIADADIRRLLVRVG